MLRNTSYLVHPDTFFPSELLPDGLQVTYFEHLQVMRIEFLALIRVPHAIILPELPSECLP